MRPIKHISGYQFIALSNLPVLRETLEKKCLEWTLKGTILLSSEGVNINLCGSKEQIDTFLQFSKNLDFTIPFKCTKASRSPYKRLKVKIKKEIITFRNPTIRPQTSRAPVISPKDLKHWLDKEKDFLLLDTRNTYEIEYGTFEKAVSLEIEHFTDLKKSIKALPKEKEIVMFCTGGIRCEKAALYLKQEGFTQVYQLEGGILNYFTEVGGAHYTGDCYVFDERIALNANLETVDQAN